MTNTTYECSICQGVNASQHFHCQYCGTIPSHYSFLNAPITPKQSSIDGTILYYVTTHVAFGAIRQSQSRTIKRAIRTVRMDYYAPE